MRPSIKAALILTIFFAIGSCYYYFDLLLPQSRRQSEARAMGVQYSYGGDFYPIWLTGRALLLHRTDPYTPETTRDIQIGLYGRTMDPNRPGDFPAQYRAFSYPLYTDLLAGPLLPLTFDGVRIVLTLLLSPLTALSVFLWLRALRMQISGMALLIVIILTLVSYPVLEGLYAQQAGLLAAAALALALDALTRDRQIMSGIALACASVKPQMIWLLALFLLLWAVSDWHRRKRFALSCILSMATLCLAAELILPGWWSGWWRTAMQYSGYTLPPLPQLILGKALGTAVALAMLAAAAAIAWRTRMQPAGSPGFSLGVSLVLSVTALLLPTGGAVYDQIVLLPAIFWIWSRRADILRASPPVRLLLLAGFFALLWQWMTACAVAVISLVVPAWARNPGVLVFPTRMAASLPFVVFAIMAWLAVRYWRISAEPDKGAAPPAS
jgi:hypothetical protein